MRLRQPNVRLSNMSWAAQSAAVPANARTLYRLKIKLTAAPILRRVSGPQPNAGKKPPEDSRELFVSHQLGVFPAYEAAFFRSSDGCMGLCSCAAIHQRKPFEFLGCRFAAVAEVYCHFPGTFRRNRKLD